MPMNTLPPASAALRAFARLLHDRLGGSEVFVAEDNGRTMRVVVLLARWDRETRFGVYAAQEEADPNRFLEVTPTDRVEDVPFGATVVV